ncbi:MAG TPA: hypothetical protein VG146_16280 [Verrucomicrobiae bacterium]|nr:hypothetical protein [Verrucomicrobiae bacterium]
MKTWFILIALIAGCAAHAQDTNARPAKVQAQMQKPAPIIQKPTATLILQQPKANQIIKGKITYSGAVVEAIKTRRPLELFNPFAPPEYGSPEDNVERDSINRRVSGLKLFAIHF